MMAFRAIMRSKQLVRLFQTTPGQVQQPPFEYSINDPEKLGEELAQTIGKSFVEAVEKNNEVERQPPVPLPAHWTVPDPFPTRTYGKFNEQLNAVPRDLLFSLRSVIPGKASQHIFDFVTVHTFGEYVPLFMAARQTPLSANEVLVSAYDPAQSPLIEYALKQSGLKLEVTRKFGDIKVKILDYNKDAAIQTVTALGEAAKKKVNEIVEKQLAHAKTLGSGDFSNFGKIQLSLIDQTVAAKKRELA